MPIDFMKDTLGGRIFATGNGSPQGVRTERRGVMYLDVGTNKFNVRRNSHAGPFITIGNGSPQNVRTERPGTFYLDFASNTIGAVHDLYVNTTGLINGWQDTGGKLYVNINGSKHGWVLVT